MHLGESIMERGELLRFARIGAQARLEALQSEIDKLRKQFPGLAAGPGRGRQARGSAATAGETAAKRRMSAAGRKRISDAAKKRWAEWRKKNKK
jgi:hypothetical protein